MSVLEILHELTKCSVTQMIVLKVQEEKRQGKASYHRELALSINCCHNLFTLNSSGNPKKNMNRFRTFA